MAGPDRKIVIAGIPAWDGDYELDIVQAPLTTREWGWIKRHSGYLPLTIEDGLNDPELITVFAAIALRRAGRIDDRDVPEVFDELSDNPYGQGKITFHVGEPEQEAGPVPPQQSSSSNDDTTGLESKTSSEISLVHPRPSGTPDADSSESAQERSAR
jgi:hypothetical protein